LGHFFVTADALAICSHQNFSNIYLWKTIIFSLPGRNNSFWKELDCVKLLWKNRSNLKVEDAGVAAMFGIELYAWFCVGEIVGRGFTLTGYHV
jgi:F-type H+-transporting ATPase subunit g